MSSATSNQSTPTSAAVAAKSNSSSSSSSSTGTPSSLDTKSNRRFWCEEVNHDSIYSVYLKKITYSNCPSNLPTSVGGGSCGGGGGGDGNSNGSSSHSNINPNSGSKYNFSKSDFIKRRSLGKGKKDEVDNHLDRVTRSEQAGSNRVKVKENDGQCLQWETRQLRILEAATMEHIMEYILLHTSYQQEQEKMVHSSVAYNVLIEEERNNVAHVMHVVFITYRNYCTPYELLLLVLRCSRSCSPKQLKLVMLYWMNHFSEDFTTPLSEIPATSCGLSPESLSLPNGLSKALLKTKNNEKLVDTIISIPKLDESVYMKALTLMQDQKVQKTENTASNYPHAKVSSSCILELDAKFVAQQLTAIDLENFLSLKPYTLLSGPRSNQRVKNSIKNFNLLSKHVIVTILRSDCPEAVASHWIEIALQLRKMKNFNSLKAVIAGLTNESVHRLKTTVWSKITRSSLDIFASLSSIVGDVDNQMVLRQTQLEMEGTAKFSFEEDSFGTIPYLGTFLTDITVIDSMFPNYISSKQYPETKLVNLKKCFKQFEIITQIQLLQKNVKAALTVFHQSQQINGLSQLPTYNSTPTVPRVARLFRNWFQDSSVADLTENECYKLSLSKEPPTPKKS